MKEKRSYNKTAVLLAIFLALLCLASLASILLPVRNHKEYVADIFQNGNLIMSIPLNDSEDRIFTIEGDNGCVNEVEIRSGSICIRSADCPDKLCVRQGFISDSRLPITCLPNRLVIQLRPLSDNRESGGTPDMITY